MYEFKSLEHIDFSQIAQCMKDAFTDYCVEMDLDEEHLYNRFHSENVRYELSFGAFYENKLTALLLNAIGTYNGEQIAFDAATGVALGHRRKGLYTELFGYSKTVLKDKNFSKYVLEVIKSNTPAVATYQKMGLRIAREYACFRGHGSGMTNHILEPLEMSVKEFPLQEMEVLSPFPPSFENRTEIIASAASQYHVLYSGSVDECQAYLIYHQDSGQIKQLGRRPGKMARLEQLLLAQSRRYQDIRIHNISFEDRELIASLEKLGFDHFCDQYEMNMLL